jgi:hypothetical protein
MLPCAWPNGARSIHWGCSHCDKGAFIHESRAGGPGNPTEVRCTALACISYPATRGTASPDTTAQ